MWDKYINEKSNYRFVTSFLVMFFCLLLSFKFPSANDVQGATKNIFFLIIVPAIYIKIILKENLTDFGLNARNKKSGSFFTLIALVIFLGITYIFIKYAKLLNYYTLPAYIVNDFRFFLIYELIFSNIFLFASEFFFRGFILTILSRKISYWAILIQSLMVIFLSQIGSKGTTMTLFIFITSIITGTLAYRCKSFVYSYVMILISSIIIDAYIIQSLR